MSIIGTVARRRRKNREGMSEDENSGHITPYYFGEILSTFQAV